jgi:hypothetical protein
MRVGITEIMDTGHIALAETLCKIFCSDFMNQVILFTIKGHADNLNQLTEKYPNLSIIVKPSQQKEEDFLKKIGSFSFDRLYVVTLNKFIPAFSRWQITSRLFLVIHNLDEWFYISLLQNISNFFNAVIDNPHFKLLVYFFKLHFIYPSYKKHILKIILQTNGSVVVLSESVRREVKKLNITIPVEVVPFSVFEPSLVNEDLDTQKPLRICVPGILSQYRRNYLALLDVLEMQLGSYKNRFIIDFLGGIQSDNLLNDSNPLLERINRLNNDGFTIYVYPVRFIPPIEYDRELSLADIVLGNMNVVLNKISEYGKTKETGIPFAMIKAAKPGILPYNYPSPDELQSSIILYHNFQDLGKILINLINDRQSIIRLKKEALVNSEKFSPEIIYNQLVSNKLNTRP